MPSEWKSKVAEHTWWLGDMIYTENAGNQVGENVFAIENGKVPTEYDMFLGEVEKISNPPDGALISEVNSRTSSQYNGKQIYYKRINDEKWIKKLKNEKVGLLYLSDYYLSQGKNINCYSNGECKNGWMHISNNDKNIQIQNEWLIAFFGFDIYWGHYRALEIREVGSPGADHAPSQLLSVRPVIYLNSGLQLSGTGTITDPYIITN